MDNSGPLRGIINCISGGYAGGGETSSARKRSYRAMLAIEGTTKHSTTEPEITFCQNDLASPNLDDLVVISIQIGELLVQNNIATVHSDRQQARQCYNASLKKTSTEQRTSNGTITPTTSEVLMLADLDPREDFMERPQPIDELQKVPLTTTAEQFTYIGRALEGEEKSKLIKVLRDNADLFAWKPADMPGIDPNVICHKLAIDNASKPVKQKKRNLGAEKAKAALEETKKLLHAGFIKELRFTTWLSNVVMILMHPEDQSKTAFITEHRNFCYKVMPFGLKNAGATYQRLMDKVFQQQIGRNIEIYVDDMVAKTPSQGSHCEDLHEIFQQIRAYNMRLNPEKCAFGVRGGKFLGFMLTSRGIEANPEKCEAILNTNSPKTVKEVQQLAGRVAALSRFIPAVANRSYHFFRTISKNKKFNWTEECEQSFSELKQILSSPPILRKPELETRYPKIQQLALALVTTARRLRQYFQSHVIIVRTNQPLRQILTKPELAGRLTKWSIELSEYDIQYQPRKSPRLQILADFLSELTNEDIQAEQNWSLYVDGASNKEGSGAGVTLKEGEHVIAEQSLQFTFAASNNQAEYETLLAGLKLAQDLHIPHLTVYCDSLLVVQQIKGDFQVKDPSLERYWLLTKDLIKKFDKFDIIHINREQNTRADILSKLATTRSHLHTPTLSQLTLEKPSFETHDILSITQEKDWRTPFIEYITTGVIPADEQNEKLIRRRASYYTILGENLYRRGLSQPLLKCLNKSESETVMAETHEGICGNHIGGQALSTKILRAGYYWLTMKRDCIAKVQKCDNCQKHSTISTTPA
ncbi:uncharacterized protein LOC107633647 [Arachis ipaensis]|uniref:uncharacterized protein LOC107633647 n=1 Tax=Arachis ipaensis TaxID=130454 RepID=UPI0007AFC2EB|nr:uncharacterized protein LOC107633647 [Arachis ipaensis]XP_025640726.1 uncharacterized protein LOC112735401 [Arachis hypogaea]